MKSYQVDKNAPAVQETGRTVPEKHPGSARRAHVPAISVGACMAAAAAIFAAVLTAAAIGLLRGTDEYQYRRTDAFYIIKIENDSSVVEQATEVGQETGGTLTRSYTYAPGSGDMALFSEAFEKDGHISEREGRNTVITASGALDALIMLAHGDEICAESGFDMSSDLDGNGALSYYESGIAMLSAITEEQESYDLYGEDDGYDDTERAWDAVE